MTHSFPTRRSSDLQVLAYLATIASAEPRDELIVPDGDAWRRWLDENHASSDGVWLVMAKKGVTEPTSARVEDALQHALCYGSIDGQRRSRDDRTFLQRFTPRRRSEEHTSEL